MAIHGRIMGAGKTTVIAPLLVMLVSSGDCLVTQCVPSALLRMSVSVLRRAFGTVLTKEVYQLSVDRASLSTLEQAENLFRKMSLYQRTSSVVVTSPETIKSIMLVYVELLYAERHAPLVALQPLSELHDVADVKYAADVKVQVSAKQRMADLLRRSIVLWGAREKGILLLDEVVRCALS